VDFWKTIYKFFRSKKLAIVLILYLVITSAISTLIPQGEEPSFYYQNYSKSIAWLITSTQFYRLFRSILFLFPAAIFTLSLLICTIDRLYRRLKSKAKKRFGPDIIHVGVLLLIIGGIIGYYERKEALHYLGVGDSVQLPGGYVLLLKSYEFQKYEDGRPKDWLSAVDVMKNGDIINSSTIEVNKPLKIGRLKVFQSSYIEDYTADLSDLAGESYTIRPGDYYIAGDSIVVFRGIETGPENEFLDDDGCDPISGLAVFEELAGNTEGSGHTVKAVHRVAVSEQIDGYTVEKLCILNQTGLQVVEDRSFLPVLVSLVLIGLGVSLTFIQKMGDQNI
jgi:cytochrome c biogenesis protein